MSARLPSLSLVGDGVDGDRLWGILDRGDGRILTARREPRLLFAASRLGTGDVPLITLPDGRVLTGPGPDADDSLSGWLGKPVTLVSATERDASRAEYFADATDDSSRAIERTMPKDRFFDAYPILAMSTAGLRGGATAYAAGAWDVRRFRPNILIELEGEGWPEDAWAERGPATSQCSTAHAGGRLVAAHSQRSRPTTWVGVCTTSARRSCRSPASP